MVKYCSECGAELEDTTQFCNSCGASQKENSNRNKIIIIGLIAVIVVISILLVMSIKSGTELTIKSDNVINSNDHFKVRLTSNGQGIEGKEVHITFKGNEVPVDFDSTTNSKGIATITPGLRDGKYDVECVFDGDDKYSESSVKSEITIEPDYMSFDPVVSFSSTDKNHKGYVVLSDMNIAHTPSDISKKMFDDADENNDGKLNDYEYHKFMYLLNHDRAKYGLS